MNDLPAVRGLQPEIEAAGVNTLLLNIHESPDSQLLQRFDFRATPTFIVFAADGHEVLRNNTPPSLNEILSALNS